MYKYISVLAMLIFSIALAAQTAVPPAIGEGTVDDPYQIESLDNLYWISQNNDEWDKHYIQTNDVDASATAAWPDGGWEPIGTFITPWEYEAFTGVYDGQGYVIDGLYINRNSAVAIGFFRYTEGAEIRNLGLTNVEITGYLWVGSLVGWSIASTFENCFSTGSVTGQEGLAGLIGLSTLGVFNNCYSECSVTGSGSFIAHVGGLIARAEETFVNNCYATGDVYGGSDTGGLIGRILEDSVVQNSYSTGSVTGDSDTGGFVGIMTDDSVIINCYSTGSVTGNVWIGGLVGTIGIDSVIIDSYSIGTVISDGQSGGLIGDNWDCPVTNSYWDIESSGKTTSFGGIGRTTEEMTFPYADNTFLDWDFVEVWGADQDYSFNNGYPYLLSFAEPTEAIIIFNPEDFQEAIYYGENIYLTTVYTNQGNADLELFIEVFIDDNSVASDNMIISPDNTGFFDFIFTSQDYEPSIISGAIVVQHNATNQESPIIIPFTIEILELPVPVNLEIDDYHGVLSWEEPYYGNLQFLHFVVLLDDEEIAVTDSTDYQFENLIHNQTYTAGVAAVYNAGQSETVLIDFTYTGTHTDISVTMNTMLGNNYPNPFNPTTTISFSLREPGIVVINIFDIRGALVRRLTDDYFTANHHNIVWDGRDNSGKKAGSGVYFYKMKTQDYQSVKKMLLLK